MDGVGDPEPGGPIRVLHVDDDTGFADLTASFLERANERIVVETATSAREGLARLEDGAVDCVVADYEMPETNGIEFLERVRERWPDKPFVLFTGRGSEDVASDAISAGVTDYLQKGASTERYELLANRVENVVDGHRSRQLLAERTRRLETLISNLPGIVYRCRNEPGWPMTTVEGEVARLTGYTSEQLEDSDVTWGEDVLHEADRDRIWEHVQDSLATNESFEVTYRIVTADGDTRWMWERGQLVDAPDGEQRVLEGFITDITDRKERERELEEQAEALEAQYRYLFEEAPVMAVVTREEDGKPVIDDCNQRFAETVGESREDIVGTPLATYYTADSARKLLDGGGYDRALAGEFVREDRELLTADGDVVETLLRAVPRYDACDEVVGTLALYIDISERKELEREKERLEEFTSIVSHDLRNPLNVAKSRTKLARDEGDISHLDAAIRAHDRMEALIDDLLTLARTGEEITDWAVVDLSALAERCWETLPADAATLDVRVDCEILADRGRLQQLVENLLTNAVDHGGEDVAITVGELEDGFYVADDGPGIPPDERDEVFDAGYSTVQDGTGFGLRIVQQVAAAHGWHVDVTESEAGGARFEIRGVEFG